MYLLIFLLAKSELKNSKTFIKSLFEISPDSFDSHWHKLVSEYKEHVDHILIYLQITCPLSGYFPDNSFFDSCNNLIQPDWALGLLNIHCSKNIQDQDCSEIQVFRNHVKRNMDSQLLNPLLFWIHTWTIIEKSASHPLLFNLSTILEILEDDSNLVNGIGHELLISLFLPSNEFNYEIHIYRCKIM